jgi:hypothetical protein
VTARGGGAMWNAKPAALVTMSKKFRNAVLFAVLPSSGLSVAGATTPMPTHQ